jgi:hypothetical protein
MRRMQRILMLTALVALAPALSGCENFDMDKLDVFGLSDKKKLPGDRKAVFPEGVPGVSQGIPQEYIKGNAPPPDTAQALPAEPAAKTAAKTAAVEPAGSGLAPKPKPKPKAKPKPKPRVTVSVPAQSQPAPAASAQPAPQQAPAPWPEPAQSGSGTAPWPAAPAPGTFSR